MNLLHVHETTVFISPAFICLSTQGTVVFSSACVLRTSTTISAVQRAQSRKTTKTPYNVSALHVLAVTRAQRMEISVYVGFGQATAMQRRSLPVSRGSSGGESKDVTGLVV
jgi:hypothetical protein